MPSPYEVLGVHPHPLSPRLLTSQARPGRTGVLQERGTLHPWPQGTWWAGGRGRAARGSLLTLPLPAPGQGRREVRPWPGCTGTTQEAVPMTGR